ncbi:hypothetical protein ACFWNT_41770 [Streptomyces sp. NPDC058409]|uniref:hypothetical protein n=1 Tax=Streptomyces sp. NPDC058409 TaxID=3346484 RepID=UPI00364BB448
MPGRNRRIFAARRKLPELPPVAGSVLRGLVPVARDIVRLLMSVVFHDLAGACRVPEGPIAHSELAALTRRFEEVAEKTDREFGIIKSDLTAVRLQVGNLDQKVDRIDGRLDALSQQMERNQAQNIELLTHLVGRNPDAAG